MSQNRYVVVPTVTVLAVMKARLSGAVKGHALLKKKADALTVRWLFGKLRDLCLTGGGGLVAHFPCKVRGMYTYQVDMHYL